MQRARLSPSASCEAGDQQQDRNERQRPGRWLAAHPPESFPRPTPHTRIQARPNSRNDTAMTRLNTGTAAGPAIAKARNTSPAMRANNAKSSAMIKRPARPRGHLPKRLRAPTVVVPSPASCGKILTGCNGSGSHQADPKVRLRPTYQHVSIQSGYRTVNLLEMLQRRRRLDSSDLVGPFAKLCKPEEVPSAVRCGLQAVLGNEGF
jgi:hypothetical protein